MSFGFGQFTKFLQNFTTKQIYRIGLFYTNRNTTKNIQLSSLKRYRNFSSSSWNRYYSIIVPGSLCFIAFSQKSSSTSKESQSNKPTSSPSLSLQKFQSKMTEEQSSLQTIIQHADQLFDENHFQEVYDMLCKYEDQSLSDVNWRKARALFQLSKQTKDKNERIDLIKKSFNLIKDALDKEDNNFAIHKWMAIILDSHAELDGIKSRITQIGNLSKHMQRAVELNPNDPTSWYLLGAFEFGLADIPWIQRKVLSTIFATPPNGTYEKALEYFQKAESLREGFYSMNWLMIGKCYYSLKDYDNARTYFEKAANCRVLNEDDKNCKEEAQKLLKKV